MKRLLSFLLSLTLLFALVGCVNEKGNSLPDDELHNKAMAILNELGEDQRVKDFRNAYELLTTLPDEENKFISQLKEIENIYKKYNVELNSGDYFLNPTVSLTKENIGKYCKKGAYYDAADLLNVTVYPALFDNYGQAAQNINGLTSDKITAAIKSLGNWTVTETKSKYDGYTEIWEYTFFPNSKTEIKYHNNGVLQSIEVPIICSNESLSDAEYAAFFEKDVNSQKQLAGSRFTSMLEQFDTIVMGSEILEQIFSREEIIIISNYIHSLSLNDIWKRNLLAVTDEPSTYFSAIVVFDYKGYNISINFGLNDISLNIMSNKIVNDFTNRWYTVYCGLCLPDGEGKESLINTYIDCINNNITSNDVVQDYSYDLNANAEKYNAADTTNSNSSQDDIDDVQQSVPVEMSMCEKATVFGVIEKNDSAFPTYRLHTNTKLTFIFDEYLGEKVFECEYLYFYDDPELNNNYPLEDFVGDSCKVTALLEDFRGGDELFLLNPIISIN